MMFDIDQFKLINDRYGHSMGDFVLSVFAQRLKTNLRGVDLIARMGGEEFLVVIPRVSNERAQHLAERLRAVVAETPFIDPQSTKRANVTVSIGLAAALPVDNACKLLDRADIALYKSKSSGRDQVTFHSQAA
jgi:two-component system cell cycle response regulator